MNNDYQYRGCCEEYAELCALSTSGELSTEEWAELEIHVAECERCEALLRDYTSLVHVAMPKLGPADRFEQAEDPAYDEHKMEQRLVAALNIAKSPQVSAAIPSVVESRGKGRPKRFIIAAGIAAVLLVGIAGAFQLGRQSAGQQQTIAAGQPTHEITSQPTPLNLAERATLEAEKRSLQEKLVATQTALDQVNTQSSNAAKHVAELTSAQAALQSRIDDLTKQEQATTASLIASMQQSTTLQQQLAAAATSLQQVRDDLTRAQQERQGAVLRVADLENEVNSLHAAKIITDRAASGDEQFLAQDRDIRELMGARQLYIADVFDVQNDGQKSKPYGRVFYTRGRSLLFYAFDLDSQPGLRDAKAFQAWGALDSSEQNPISLGVFYMDSQSNRRWIMKSDNPQVLAQINAVFVTVEPKGGSVKPTGKRFLEAYLHSLPPNHP
jgi:hypothetical protein